MQYESREPNVSRLARANFTYEWEVPWDFEPCGVFDWETGGHCTEVVRVIRLVPSNSGKALYCARDHHHDFEGKTFIPRQEFGPGGAFYGILPPELTPNETQLRAARWKISKTVQELLSDRNVCAMCAIPEFNAWENADLADIWQWIMQYDTDLFKEIRTVLSGGAPVNFSDWFALLPGELRARVQERLNMSILVYDHGLPRKIGNQVWPMLSRPARDMLQQGLIFKICRKCNGTKSGTLPPLDVLLNMYTNYYFDGSESAARANPRWSALEEVISVVYGDSSRAV
jgi:hypothetical protein